LTLKQAAELFGLLANERRLRLLARLVARGEAHAGGLGEDLSMSQPTVSNHVMLLRRGHLVWMRRQGQRTYYRIHAPQVKDLLRLVCGTDVLKGTELLPRE
jgi:ArsR family transcriptional regulator